MGKKNCSYLFIMAKQLVPSNNKSSNSVNLSFYSRMSNFIKYFFCFLEWISVLEFDVKHMFTCNPSIFMCLLYIDGNM